MPHAHDARQRLLQVDPDFRFARWTGFTIAPSAHQDDMASALRAAGVPE